MPDYDPSAPVTLAPVNASCGGCGNSPEDGCNCHKDRDWQPRW